MEEHLRWLCATCFKTPKLCSKATQKYYRTDQNLSKLKEEEKKKKQLDDSDNTRWGRDITKNLKNF